MNPYMYEQAAVRRRPRLRRGVAARHRAARSSSCTTRCRRRTCASSSRWRRSKPGELFYGSAGNGSRRAPGDGVPQAGRRHRPASTCPTRAPGRTSPTYRRAHAGRLRGHAAAHAAREERQAARHRRRRREAPGVDSRGADGRRAGLPGLRDLAVVRPQRAGEDAAARSSSAWPRKRPRRRRARSMLERLARSTTPKRSARRRRTTRRSSRKSRRAGARSCAPRTSRRTECTT